MDPTARTKLLENIQNDLKNISLETKKTKSLQPIRESTDEAIVKIRSLVRVSLHVFTNPEFSICNCFFSREKIVLSIQLSVILVFHNVHILTLV